MNANPKFLVFLSLTVAVMTGCTKDMDLYQGSASETLKPESEYFDFNINNTVTFDINYGSAAKSVLLQIFDEPPITYNSNGSFTVSGNPVYKIFTDSEGKFNGSVELLSSVDSVYIYSSSWSAPTCIAAAVVNNTVELDLSSLSSSSTAKTNAAMTRANGSYSSRVINAENNLYAILTWGKYGKIDSCDVLNPKISFTDEIDVSQENLNAIQELLWNGNSSKPDKLDNSEYVVSTEHVNTTIAKAYYDDSEDVIKTVENAEVYFTFLTEWAWYQNTLGYYYYKSDEVPSSPSEVKKYILVPNASKALHVPFGVNMSHWGYPYFDNSDAPMELNTRIQLLYEDSEGNISKKFPSGYTIGFFLIPYGYKTCTNSNTNPGDNFYLDNGIVYSNQEWNDGAYNGYKSRFIAMNSTNGVVYGVEDGGEDASYDDLMFTIYANPIEAIQDPDRPTINPSKDATYTTETKTQIYAFEDIWPTGGDYDLNDVMISHTREITFNNVNSSNNVTQVVDKFTPIQPSGSATKVDAFAVQYSSNLRGSAISLPSGAIDETTTGSIILFSDAKNVRNQEFTITRTFTGNDTQKNDIEDDNLNPFIIADYVANGTSRTEVHLPKQAATSLANTEQVNSKDDAYYVDKDGKHPFAITLPSDFTPVTETVSIETEYPNFTKWVESNGTNYTDWYKNYVMPGSAE